MNKYFKMLLNIKKNTHFKEQIEYLITYKFFYKSKFQIFYPILIPQHDTENIITLCKKIIKNEKKINIYELGYGSNNINKSLKLKNLKHINIDNNFLCYLLKDKVKNKKYLFNDWLFLTKNSKQCKLIITNPPYIEKKEFTTHIKNKLKKNNLFSNNNGLKLIYDIIKMSKNILSRNGILITEHGYNQNKKIRYFSKINGFNSYALNDYNNIKRFVYLEI